MPFLPPNQQRQSTEGSGILTAGRYLSVYGVRRRRHVSTSDESSTDDAVDETPTWFYHGPFKYNGRMAVLALPGFLLAVLFSGELSVIYLSVVTSHLFSTGSVYKISYDLS